MAGRGGVARLFERHRPRLLKELDINRIFPKLARKGVFTPVEETEISSITDNIKKIEVFLDLLSVKGTKAFQEFCSSLEELSPSLLTSFLLDTSEVDDDDKPSQALQLGFELALKDRDAVLREKAKATEERDNAIRQLQQVKSERDQAITSLENLTGKPAKLSNTKRFEDSPILGARSGSPNHKNRVMESDGEVEESGDNVVWETHKVHLTKAPVFGFGIAVSGGVDSPHFANGDPSVAISDVLRAGPAEGRLQVNDRIVSVNSISLENVDHARAIQVLRDCGTAVHLVIRRRVVLPSILDSDTPPLKVTLSKKSKKDDFGVILGCRFYIKDIPGHSLAAQEGGLKVGDTVLKINNTTTENLSLIEARKLLEKGSKDKLQLIVAKHKNISHKKQNSQPKDDALPYQPGYDTLRRQQDKDDVNIYRPSVRSEDDLFKPESLPQGVPLGAYPQSEHTRYDGRYVYDHEGPPRPPLPTGFDDAPARPKSPGQSRLNPEDYYQQYPGNNNYSPHDSRLRDYDTRPIVDDDVFNTSHEEPEPRSVTFRKDADVGLGLRLAGGNSTGTFIASVQPGCAAEAQGLTEGDQIVKAWLTEHGVKANEREVTGMTREEAVNYLTSLQGEVTLVVQYKKEEYDRIMASHEAGDSFYIKTHFHYEGTANGEHSFVIGDLFHIKDTLFRGIGGSWLAIKLDKNFQETKKGTIPNTHKAETICQYQQQQNNDKENFPNKGRGSLFRRKAARRAKSLGKDHWEELIFSNDDAGLHTKFAAYQRVVLREAGFVRPVVIFGAISDIARERLISTYPERFEAPESESSSEDSKKKSGIIRLGSIRNIIKKRKHCVIDVTPHHVDRLNYAQYCPIVIYIKADNKQAIKDCRAKWKTSSKNPKKLLEHNEKLERFYSHLFTGVINHNSSDNWFPKVMEMVEAQNHQKIWMSEKKPEDDINDDFLFPMPNRMSFAGSPDSELDLSRNTGDQSGKQRLMRSSSDPSINTNDHIPGIPPYPTPPNYNHKKGYGERIPYNDDPRYDDPYSHVNGRPEDHYYPSYYAENSPSYAQNRSHIDHYATLTPSERLRHRSVEVNPGVNDYSPYKTRVSSSDLYRSEIPEYATVQKHTSPHIPQSSVPPNSNQKTGHNDSSSHSSDSYNRYVSSPSNKHDDSKLRDKFGSLVVSGQPEKGLAHDPYRFTRSTTNPVSSAHVDKAKLSDLSAKYRKDDPKPKKPIKYVGAPGTDVPPKVKKDPPPVPVKNYSLRERGVVFEDEKARNYENSNRSYSYTDLNYSSQARRDRPNYNGADNELHSSVDNTPEGPYEYVALKQPNGHVRDLRQNGVNRDKRPSDNHVDVYNNHVNGYDNQIYGTEYFPDNVYERTGKSFANHMYMDHRELDRIRSSKEQLRNDSEIYPVENGYTRPREGEKDAQDKRNSAFEAYRKQEPLSTFGKKEPPQSVKAVDVTDSTPFKPVPTPPPPPQLKRDSVYRPSPLVTSLLVTKELDVRDNDSCDGASDSISTPDTVIAGMDFGREIDENHTVVATARGAFDSRGGVLESKETGVSIIIPPGAIPDGPKQEIYFKVCRDNSILPPLDRDKGETLLSPLVMCGPHGLKFNQPVELKLPHCAAVNPDSWSFALKSSDSPSGHPTQWQNMNLAGLDGVTQGHVGKNSVSVMVDHF